MTVGMVRITFANSTRSEEWSVQHPFIYGLTPSVVPDSLSAVVVTLSGVYDAMTDANTDVGNPAFVNTTAPFVHRLVAFHRAVMYAANSIIKVEVNDGRKNDAVLGGASGTPPMFGVQAGLSLPGKMLFSGGLTADTLVGGATAILMSRNSRTPGVSNGRFYLRGHLHDQDISMSGKQLLSFTSPLAQAAINDYIQMSIGDAGLGEYFNQDLVELGWRIGIAHYADGNVLDTYNKGELIAVTPCTGFTVNRLATRQLNRGRKRKGLV